jgi:hypothetical protein
MPIQVKISRSTNPKKKLMAQFYLHAGVPKPFKTTHFGAAGYTDYTKSKDKDQRKRYLDRHRKENWNDYKSAGSLSRYILWGDSTNLQNNIKSFARRFKLKIRR